MRMRYTSVLISAVIFNFIGGSSQSESNLHSEGNPGSSSSVGQHTFDPTPTEEPPLRFRSRSPPGGFHSIKILGYSLEQLGYIRLIPRANRSLTFEFRRYIFPSGTQICWRADGSNVTPVRPQEHIVLSTSDGDVFAILTNSGSLSGLIMSKKGYPRLKINIMNSEVSCLDPDEIRYCPVGRNHPILPGNFVKVPSDYNSLQFTWTAHGKSTPCSPSSSARNNSPERTSLQELPLDARSRSPPGRPPSHEVLGYSLTKLGYVRLIPKINQNQHFEFRRYVFPTSVRIFLKVGSGKFILVPTREHIVISTSNGDVFAILEYTGILRGIYKSNKESKGRYSRIRINMISAEIHYMTESEMTECHVGKTYPISPRWYKKVVINEDSLQHVYQ